MLGMEIITVGVTGFFGLLIAIEPALLCSQVAYPLQTPELLGHLALMPVFIFSENKSPGFAHSLLAGK
jgi:hypothetical protein